MERSVPKRRHIKFRRRGITQKKEYNQQKVVLEHIMKVCRAKEVWFHSFLTLVLDEDEPHAPATSPAGKEAPVPIE
jgi:hypothetical protein